MSAVDHMGPTTVIKGFTGSKPTLQEAAALTARYGQGRDEETVAIGYWRQGDDEAEQTITSASPSEGRELARELERL
jgi:predicted ribosome quality control (RQC) complex YloA/Tae2 family protein